MSKAGGRLIGRCSSKTGSATACYNGDCAHMIISAYPDAPDEAAATIVAATEVENQGTSRWSSGSVTGLGQYAGDPTVSVVGFGSVVGQCSKPDGCCHSYSRS